MTFPQLVASLVVPVTLLACQFTFSVSFLYDLATVTFACL